MAQAHKSTCKHYGTGTQEYMQTLRHRHTRVHANTETQHTRVDTNPRPVIELLNTEMIIWKNHYNTMQFDFHGLAAFSK